MSKKLDKMEWLLAALAVSGHDIGMHFEYLTVIDGKAYASDSQRMHIAPLDLADGLYDPYTLELVTNVAVPKNFNPMMATARITNALPDLISAKTIKDFKVDEFDTRRLAAKDENSAFQKLFITQAINDEPKTVINVVGIFGDERIIFGDNSIGTFVIMGLQNMPINRAEQASNESDESYAWRSKNFSAPTNGTKH